MKDKKITPSEFLEHPMKEKSEKPIITLSKAVGRNEPCPCGSGRKFKKCCFFTESTGSSKLSRDERLVFFSLWYALLEYVNRKLRLGLKFDLGVKLPKVEVIMQLRDKLWEEPCLISRFINDPDNLYEITPEGVLILNSWQNQHIKETFLVVKYTSEHAVLMPIESEVNPVYYGVKGLESSIAEVLDYKAQTLIDAMLLPFEDKIIYDGLVAPYPIIIDKNITDRVSRLYDEAEIEGRIITSLKR